MAVKFCPKCSSNGNVLVCADGNCPMPQRLYVVPRKPSTGTGIPTDEHMHPAGCPDAVWCRGNRFCYWNCKGGTQ